MLTARGVFQWRYTFHVDSMMVAVGQQLLWAIDTFLRWSCGSAASLALGLALAFVHHDGDACKCGWRLFLCGWLLCLCCASAVFLFVCGLLGL